MTSEIQKLAMAEIEQEDLRIAIDKCKKKLRSNKWWHKFMPFKIVIIRR